MLSVWTNIKKKKLYELNIFFFYFEINKKQKKNFLQINNQKKRVSPYLKKKFQ